MQEFGIAYAELDAARDSQVLHLPVAAAKAADGSYLIVDELDYELPKGEHTQCRTIRVGADGQLLYDSRSSFISDGYGCLLEDGCMAILSRANWEIQIVSAAGETLDRLALWAFSKHYPRNLHATDTQTFLVSFLDGLGQYDVIEVDRGGRLLWHLPRTESAMRFPIGMAVAASGGVLLADCAANVALEVSRDGAVVWKWGEFGHPADTGRYLSFPGSIQALPDGGRLVADTRNHRILAISRAGNSTEIRLDGDTFCDPTYASRTAEGQYLVCDSGNARVVELDAAGGLVWQYGQQLRKLRELSYPRSVQPGTSGKLLISDTANNRVLEFGPGQISVWPVNDGSGLFWPRCARYQPSGSVLIADGRNSRVIEVSGKGELLQQLDTLQLDGGTALGDPHDVTMLENGHLLVVDSSLNLVYETDWEGQVYRVLGHHDGTTLIDPHSAEPLDGDRLLITDTGNNRILIAGGGMDFEIYSEIKGGTHFRLNTPRHATLSEDGLIVVVDTGNNRVLAMGPRGELAWELSRIPGSPIATLNYPRWAQPIPNGGLLVSDHYHHRILHLRQDTA